MRKMVFVCLGNICRSPMAEFVMKNLVEKSGESEGFEIESRATSSWEHGNPVHSGTRQIFERYRIDFDEKKSSQRISAADFERFDEIIAMDESNLRDLKQMAPRGTVYKIKMLLDDGVPDPYFTGDFEETYRLVCQGCQKLLDEK